MTVREEVKGSILQLERLYADYRSARRVAESVMRHPAKGGFASPASRPWKRSRMTATMYLTASDLQRAMDNAIGGYVEVMDENQRGITCVRYFRNRHSRVLGIVARHLREASEGADA